MASIADVFFKALLDDSALEVDAKRAGDKAGQSLAAGMKKAIGKGLLVGFSAAAAIATKGLLELDQIQAEFAADTGATADEAARAGKAINSMAGRNLQPMREIGKALAKVHTDLGLTGEAAEQTTEQFLKFARVTKRDAAEEVAAFDDILDAWGLTAADSGDIMDKLIASHQEYGGVIAEDEAALNALAPSMKALNFDIDDTIGLLNLFKASGLDAASTQRAFNTAVKNLPPGTNLRELLDEISAIEDPAERAAKAIEIFGSRGGVALANALGPGKESLDDFAISADEAKNATLDAAAAMDGTFGARVQLAIKAATSKIVEFGQAFGPALTGLAALASLGAALGLDKVVAGAFGSLKNSAFVKEAIHAAAVGAALAYAHALHLVEEIAHVVGESFEAIDKRLGIKAIVARAGGIIGSVFALGMHAGERIGEAILSAFKALPFAGKVRAVVLSAAIEMGTLWGTTFGTFGFAAIAAALPIAFLKLGEIAQTKFLEGLGQSPEQIDRILHPLKMPPATKFLWFDIGQTAAAEVTKGVSSGMAEGAGSVPAAIRDGITNNVVAGIAAAKPTINAESRKLADDVFNPELLARSAEIMRQQVEQQAGDLARSLAAGGANLAEVSAQLASQLPNAVRENRAEVRNQAVLSMVDFAAGIRDKRAQITAAIEQIGTDMENTLSSRQERLMLQGALAGDNITNGLKSKDEVVKAQAQGTVGLISQRLEELGVDATTLGGQAGKNYATALGDTKPLVAGAATAITGGASTSWDYYKKNAALWGQRTGKAYADGLRSTYGYVQDAAQTVASALKDGMKASSPPGPKSPLHKIDVWGENTAMAWIEGFRSTIRAAMEAARSVSGAAAAGLLPSPAYSLAGAVSVPGSRLHLPSDTSVSLAAAGGRRIVENHVHIEGLVKARNAFEISDVMEKFQRTGVLPEDDPL